MDVEAPNIHNIVCIYIYTYYVIYTHILCIHAVYIVHTRGIPRSDGMHTLL